MYFSTSAFVALLAAAFASAAPTAESNSQVVDSAHIRDIKTTLGNLWNQKNEKVFYFDAEYIVKATPDQVINTNQVPEPGQPGAKGLFKYGINIADNTICYVSDPLL